jgi:multidrug efflux pump subunit AcrB
LLQDVIGDLAGSPEPVELKLFSSDHAAAERAAMSIARAIEPTPGLVDLFNGVQGSSPELRMQLDPVRLARLGLTATEVEAQARAALFGANAGMAREPDRLIPIRVRLPDSVRFSRDLTAQVPVIGPSGWTQLGALGSVFDTAGASELRRENLRPYVPVTGRTSGRSLGAVMADVRAAAARVPLPAGVTMEVGGQYASQRTAFRQLLGIFALGTGAVLLVLVAQFDGFKGPLSIVLVAPLGLVGTLLLLLAAGVPFNVSSFMGIILLVGLVVKNGILLLDAARRTRAGGASYHGALVEAGRLRLRPILMTTLCTLAGLAPLAFGFGAGAELQRPLALAVVGGLTISTGVTLLLLPVVLDALGALGPHSNRAESVA